MIEKAGERVQIENDLLKHEREQDTQRHAEILAAILNTSFGPYLKRGMKYPYDAEQFLPKEKKEKPTIEQYELMLKQQTLAMGGTVTYK
jgi:hypothetical protein